MHLTGSRAWRGTQDIRVGSKRLRMTKVNLGFTAIGESDEGECITMRPLKKGRNVNNTMIMKQKCEQKCSIFVHDVKYNYYLKWDIFFLVTINRKV